jgi:predicted esterase YcpF (UPF0227 family)
MTTLIYIHGFLSSPTSHKAQITQRWLHNNTPSIHYECPYLSPYPEQTQQQLTQLVESIEGEIGLIGSSLGGFWSTWLIEKYGFKGVLINPSVKPFEFMGSLIGQSLHNYYTQDSYTMTENHTAELIRCYQKVLSHPENYWIKVQEGDETLDYNQAVVRYESCRVDVEKDGDHGFVGYESHMQGIVDFLFG